MSLIREKASTELTEDEEDYVYDIYYMNSGKFDFHELESDLTVEAMYQDMMVYDEYRASECTEAYEYDDDSNDEDNWRNDYPDEDPKFFENEDTEYRYGCGECVISNMYGGQSNKVHSLIVMDYITSVCTLIVCDEKFP